MDKKQQLLAKERYNIDDLIDIMTLLRAPDGCPWDREQTHESIRNNFIEETYEVVEAIDTNDSTLLCEELGDVLLQVIFHSRLSEEEGKFSFDDVVNGVCAKLVLRHPHIFGSVRADSTDEVLKNWDSIKQESHGRKTVREALDGVSKALPALMRAGKLAKKAAKNGVVFENIYGGEQCDSLEQRIGGELFAAAASAEMHGINAEEALSRACDEFINNFDK